MSRDPTDEDLDPLVTAVTDMSGVVLGPEPDIPIKPLKGMPLARPYLLAAYLRPN